jgi:serine/threonine-protein kinase
MALAPGTRLGVYEVVSLLGEGGMGQVFRARDTKLGREVALKVLPEYFAADPERSARFEREAQVLASLNHPHIATLHGMEAHEASHVLVMELVEGDTLAERIRRGPLPAPEALGIAIQIADALQEAHDKGVVHRDLKPANIKITPDGKVKVLDFGLARAADVEPSAINVTHSPTLSLMATQAGVVLGTAAYMSPEQAKGLRADHRSDIFSFGIVLYEMLAGRQPFQGETAPDVMASVLARDPDLTVLPPALHPRLLESVRRCLEKQPRRRWQAIGDLKADLEEIAVRPLTMPLDAAASTGRNRPLWMRSLVVGGTALVAASLTAAAFVFTRTPAPQPIIRFTVPLEEGTTFTNLNRQALAISGDGSTVAFVASARLFTRRLDESRSVAIGSIEGARDGGANSVVFSPDARMLAYYSNSMIRRVAIAGGAPVALAQLEQAPYGLSWDGDAIFVGQGTGGIVRVPATGGRVDTLVTVADGEEAQGPQLLPDGDTLLYTVATGNALDRWDTARIVARSLATGETRTLIEGGADARYVATGYLVYAVGGVLFAAPFDADRLQLTGPAVPAVQGVSRAVAAASGTAQFAVSATGVLAYIAGPVQVGAGSQQMVLTDLSDGIAPLKLPASTYESLRISPDGSRVVYSAASAGLTDVWVYDLDGRTAARRLTFSGLNRYPIWNGDGTRVIYQSNRDGASSLYWQAADGSGAAEPLTMAEGAAQHAPASWLPGGGVLYTVESGGSFSMWTLSMPQRQNQRVGSIESTDPLAPALSPDGRWLAYTLAEASHVVYVEPFPLTGARYQISKGDDGHHPVWSRDGRQLYYIPGPAPAFAVVQVSTTPTFTFSDPQPLARSFTLNTGPIVHRSYDITPDGRFLGLVVAGEAQSGGGVEVVVNWLEELKPLMRAN